MTANGIDPSVPPSGPGCVECEEAGGWWVHLRRCAQCGHVGCCDSSPSQHATAHHRDDRAPGGAELRAGGGLVLGLRHGRRACWVRSWPHRPRTPTTSRRPVRPAGAGRLARPHPPVTPAPSPVPARGGPRPVLASRRGTPPSSPWAPPSRAIMLSGCAAGRLPGPAAAAGGAGRGRGVTVTVTADRDRDRHGDRACHSRRTGRPVRPAGRRGSRRGSGCGSTGTGAG